MQALLIQLGAKECLVVDQDKALEYDLGKIKSLMERCGIVITERKKSESIRVRPDVRVRLAAFSQKPRSNLPSTSWSSFNALVYAY